MVLPLSVLREPRLIGLRGLLTKALPQLLPHGSLEELHVLVPATQPRPFDLEDADPDTSIEMNEITSKFN